MFTASNPGVALTVHPRLLEFHATCDHDLSVARGCDQERVAQLGVRLDKLMAMARTSGRSERIANEARALLASCHCDVERLALLDLVADFQLTPALFVADARLAVSSPVAAVAATTTASHYTQENGIIFETSNLQEQPHGIHAACLVWRPALCP